MIEFLFFVIGACFGSFANVCIYRLPRKKSIVAPSSFCPKCRKPLLWYDNIPILSYLILGGKCRFCGKTINIRYLVVELLMGLFSALLYEKLLAQGLVCTFIAYFIFILAVVITSGIDWETFLIPDVIVIPGILFGIVAATVCPNFFFFSTFEQGPMPRFIYSLGGAIGGAVVIGLLALLGRVVWKKDAMGGGDIKLLAMIGAFLGWKSIFLAIFFGSLIGTVFSIALIAFKKKKWEDYVPFGPYLSLGAIIALFWKGCSFLGMYIP
jgi:leader peptidase (prepilin peptidase)/N-methyltransferase